MFRISTQILVTTAVYIHMALALNELLSVLRLGSQLLIIVARRFLRMLLQGGCFFASYLPEPLHVLYSSPTPGLVP